MCDKNATMIERYELVEVLVQANQPIGQVNLPPNISNLQNNPERKIFIKDVEIFPDYAQAASVKNSSTPGLPVADISKISLSLYYGGAVFIRYIPLAKMIYTVPPALVSAPYQRERVAFNQLYPVNIDQCFLQFNSVGSATTYVVPIGFTYTWAPVVNAK